AALVEIALLLQLGGLFADFVLVLCVSLHFFVIFGANGLGFFLVDCRQHAQQIRDRLVRVHAAVLGLVVGPLIHGLPLQQQLFGVRGVPEKREGGNQNREDGDGDGNRDAQRAAMRTAVIAVAFKFLHVREASRNLVPVVSHMGTAGRTGRVKRG